MPPDEFNGDDAASALCRLKLGVSRLTEALQALDGAGVPLAASYVHLAIHMCVSELKKREE